MGLSYAGVGQVGSLYRGAEETEFHSPGILNFGMSVLYNGAEISHANAP